MQFIGGVSRRKNRRCFPAVFFLLLYMTVYQSALIARKVPCLKNFLVTRLLSVIFVLFCSFYVEFDLILMNFIIIVYIGAKYSVTLFSLY